MKSLTIKTMLAFCAFFATQSCVQLLVPNETMIDTLLSQQKVVEILTRQEWLNYQYFDSYTLTLPEQGIYSSGTNQILHLESNGRFSERTNSLFPQIKAQGKWRFISAAQSEKINLQKEERYKRVVQGNLVLLDSMSNPQKYLVTNIDTLREGFSIVIVSNREFFSLHSGIHGPVSWYYRAR